MCQHILNYGKCPNGDYCLFSHNSIEQKYHPLTQHSDQGLKKEIELSSFKTVACAQASPHSHKHCVCYHSYIDKRRPLENYSSKRCKHFNTNQCPLQDSCPCAHNKVERLYHPEKFRSKYCSDFKHNKCLYDSYCCFAHSDEELTISRIDSFELNDWFYLHLFKTIWCPFNHSHNKANCVYAHNWQDFRRRPCLFRYVNQMCPNWDGNKYLSTYESGCKNMAFCNYCHGWKELQFHPMNYRANACSSGEHYSQHCSNFHSGMERRVGCEILEHPLVFFKMRLNIGNINDQVELSLKQGKLFLNLNYLTFDEESEYDSKLTMGKSMSTEVAYNFPEKIEKPSFSTTDVKENKVIGHATMGHESAYSTSTGKSSNSLLP